LAEWKQVVDSVHSACGLIGPQIWHMGIADNHHPGWVPPVHFEGSSGLNKTSFSNGTIMTTKNIEDTILAFGQAAADAKRLGFDCIEIQGDHNYLIDQFFWDATNQRTDIYGGKNLAERTRFTVEVIKEIRKTGRRGFCSHYATFSV
jgi:2,4-dienoyl-CoA reductase-like NADH-dependent reductase (Old Yellow Enzyme family)